MSNGARDAIYTLVMILIGIGLMAFLVVAGEAWLPKQQPAFAVAALALIMGVVYVGVTIARRLSRWFDAPSKKGHL